MPDTHIPVPPLEYKADAKSKPPRKHKRWRGLKIYLMVVGALATVAALVLLIVQLLVAIENWVH